MYIYIYVYAFYLIAAGALSVNYIVYIRDVNRVFGNRLFIFEIRPRNSHYNILYVLLAGRLYIYKYSVCVCVCVFVCLCTRTRVCDPRPSRKDIYFDERRLAIYVIFDVDL